MLSQLYRMVHSVLAREGVNATLTQLGSTGTYNPATGEYSPAASTTTTVRVALVDFSYERSGLSTSPNTLIEIGDKNCYMDAKINGVDLTVKPSPAGDTITVNGTTYRVIAVQEFNPTSQYTIMYQLLLRK